MRQQQQRIRREKKLLRIGVEGLSDAILDVRSRLSN